MRSHASSVIVVTALLLLAAPSEALHHVDHRYLVLGYVRDTTRRAVARAAVRVVREKTGLAYEAETDDEGFYVVIVHLHDEDFLDRLLLGTGVGFNIQWPAVPTVMMAPALVAMYVRLARREDEELATMFGEEFLSYATRTPAFVPWGRPSVPWRVRERALFRHVAGEELPPATRPVAEG